ncbi:hypothetical protein RND61_28425 [Streptomyces sp. TRM76323]|uniref:Aspartyl/asparaginy/proline hydroxylase domain-containing protein n=1 Tax=Streptomyces tamarix TaxID=3078565 RepID=A0ABU3QT48_9ACTN|nr:hypothetical protein [Streptomyces tamarix]MDT9685966.1 hypothetical protein [Streptomyces tamarix]
MTGRCATGAARGFDPGGRDLPNSAELSERYDPDRLRAELVRLTGRYGSPLSAAVGRRVLPLISPGGDVRRVDPGGPGLQDFLPTRWLPCLPSVQDILARLPAPPRGVRLIALSPGTRYTHLQSAKLGPPWGLCRLHLPVVGGPGTRTVFPRETLTWTPGTVWFSAAWRAHALVNDEGHETVQLLVDVCHTAELAALFPRALRRLLTGPGVLVHRPEVPLPPEGLRAYRCRFPLPETFANWEQPGHRLPGTAGRTTVRAEVDVRAGTPLLVLAGRPFCALQHLGAGEFRFRGWSDERTLQVVPGHDGERHRVVLRAREGRDTYVVELPATSAE